MEDWQKHIRKDASSSYCGATLTDLDWALMGIDHAEACIKKGTLIQPCPFCLEALALRKDSPNAD